MRIRTQLILTAAAVLLPVLAAGAVAIDYIVRQEREAALRGLAETARATALLVDREVWASISRLRALALSAALARGDLPAFEEQAGTLDGSSDRWILLTDASGRVLMSTRASDKDSAADRGPLAPQEAAWMIDQRAPQVSDVLQDPVTGGGIVLVQLPVRGRNGMPAVLAEAFATTHWQHTALRPKLPQAWTAAISDSRLRLISRSRDAQALAGQAMVPAVAQAAAAAKAGRGVVRTVGREGEPIYAAFSRSDTTGWTVGVGAPVALLEAPARRALWLALGGLLLTVAVGTLAVMWFGRGLSRELADAGAAARDIGMGLRPRMRPSRLAEIARLKDSIHEAAGLLQHERHSRSAAEDAMLQLEQRLASILRTANDAIIITDEQQAVMLYNDAAEAMFGWRRDQVLDRDIRRVLPADGWSRCIEPSLAAAPDSEGSRMADRALMTATRADGTQLRVECSVSRLIDPEGGTFFTVILRDVTQRQRDQEALVRAHEDLRRATQRYQRALISEVEAGHARIAQELHDSVGSALAGILLLLRVARDRAGETSLKLLVQKASSQLADSADALRKISRGIMPVGSEAGALLKALELYAQDLSSYKGVACTVRARGEPESIAPDVGAHLYRIVQEAVANSVRHGGARRLRIRLVQGRHLCRLTVLDDGSGCAADALRGGRAGMGLRSMQVRAQAIGGRLEVANYGEGCRVRVSWPRGAANTPATDPAPLEQVS